MKVTVIRAFVDRFTGRRYNAGNAYESNNGKRVAELQKKGFLKEDAEPKPAPPPVGDQSEKPADEAAGQPAGQASSDENKPKDQD